jgi:iron(III) transport system permease protein
MPILAVLWIAATPTENIWPHLMATTLPRYLGNTLTLMLAVGVGAAVIGAGTAWLVTMSQFPGRGWLEWVLLFPLAVPGYLGAYALVDFLEYAGPVQTALRQAMGWQSARDYAFPDIRSMGGAILVLTLSLYPYVYLLARVAFADQSGAAHETARALGASGSRRFFRIGLPLARPAIAAGVAVVMMETVNDFGTVDFFGVQTLTMGVFAIWLEGGNAGGAAQIACVMMTAILILVVIEKSARRRARHFRMAKRDRAVSRQELTGWRAGLATLACLLPVLLGFVLPVAVLLWHGAMKPERWVSPGLSEAVISTVLVGGVAALVTVGAALFMTYGVRLSGRALPRQLLPLTMIGYAVPGAVLAVGLLIPLSTLDNSVADAILALTGYDPGLMLTGGILILIYAYAVRFFALGQGAVDTAMGRVPPSLPMASRTLGQGAGGTLRRIYLPLMRASIATGLILVFVDCVKELPATLLLRPFGFETLATRAHEQASLERIAEAAPPGLLIVAASLIPVILLARAMPRR